MAQQARAVVTREAILRAAGVVFSNVNYSAATLADVIAEAGVTQGALYFHFDSKHDLALEVIRRQHATSIAVAASADPTGIEGLIALSRQLARQITEDPLVRGGLRLTTEAGHLFPEYASKPYLDWIDAAAAFLDRAKIDGEVKSELNTETLSRFIIASFTGVQYVSQALSGWGDLDDRLDEMWTFLLPSILTTEHQKRAPELAQEGRKHPPEKSV